MFQFLLKNDKRVPNGDITNNFWIKDNCVVTVVADSDFFPLSSSLRCRCCSPWTSWLRPHLGECFPMRTHTTSTPSLSTATMKHLCPPMTWGSTCGTWRSQTEASVSFHFIKFCLINIKLVFVKESLPSELGAQHNCKWLVFNLNGSFPH